MPKPTCVQCGSNESLLWRSQEVGQVCNECYLSRAARGGGKEGARSEDEEAPAAGRATARGTRKSTRATRYKPPPPPPPPPGDTPPRARSRRAKLKRPPLRAPTATATIVTGDSLFYKGTYMQVGDIVSVEDVAGGTYYAQLRGFLTDQYCEKSAVLTWLLPTRASPAPEEGFDPATYIIGPEEELPRKLEYMRWVMHAPSDYYRAEPGAGAGPAAGFVWAAMDAPPAPAQHT